MNPAPRYYHVRAPLMVKQFIGNKEVTPAVIPNLVNANGGCTISIEPHDAEYVKVRVAWCRFTDNYSRKLGRIICNGGAVTKKVGVDAQSGEMILRVLHEHPGKEPTLVRREDLEHELEEIERQMLLSTTYPLRHDPELLEECLGDWSRAAARYNNVSTT